MQSPIRTLGGLRLILTSFFRWSLLRLSSLFRVALLTHEFGRGLRKGCPKQSCQSKLVSILRLTAVPTCRKNTYYAKRKSLQLCCWNVRTLIDNEKRIERKTAVLAKELQRYNVDIAALSETRFAGEDQIVESDSGYTIFWSGKTEKEKRESGVGFAVKTSLVDKIEQPVGINDRIMKLRIPLAAGRFMTILSVYAPTLVSSEEDITSFYHTLRSLITSTPNSESLVILGDLNARVGSDAETWSPLGPYGTGSLNSNGLLLLQLCTELKLAITNTFFHQKNKATWFHPQSKHGHILDYIICRRSDLRNFCKVKVMRGADCDTDHLMVRAKLKISIRRKSRFNGVKVPKRIDVSKLKDPTVKNTLKSAYDQVDFSDLDWDGVKGVLYDIGAETLGMRVPKHRDWFADNSSAINPLIEEKRKAHLNLLNASATNRSAAAAHNSSVKGRVQRSIRQIKNKWWSDLSEEIQLSYNSKDMKTFYALLQDAYGPKSSSITPLLAKDGTTLLKRPDEIMGRWYEHFLDLFHNPSEVDDAAIDSVPQRPLHPELDREPTLEETIACIKRINTNKAPGLDGVPVELLIHGGMNVHQAVHSLILCVWRGEPAAQDWIDAILIMLYKGKGKKSLCGSYRGISLLEAVGKAFARLLLDRLEKYICPEVIPESQSGFRGGRGTVDMIFSAKQLVEKCIEQRLPLCQVFVDLTKAFDTVNREALWKVLGKFGCTSGFVDKFKQLHRSMKGRVNFNGQLTEELPMDNGVKQGDIPAPTLFSLYLTAVLWYAFHDCDLGVYFRFRTTGKLFNLRRFQAKTLVIEGLVRELLYADDADLVTHTPAEMQLVMDRFANACTSFGLTISIEKTKVMYTPGPGETLVEPDIFVYGKRLVVVKDFIYLGSKLADDGSLDAEVRQRISKASGSFGKLEDRVWSDRDLTLSTKLTVYETCVLSSLLYASETWTLYRSHIKLLDRFHQQCLRHILGIKWENRVPDTEVLSKAKTVSIAAIVTRNQLRWAGHLVRLDDSRLPKQLLYGELASGKRPQHKPKKRFKDSVKESLKHFSIPVDNWESLTTERDEWRSAIFKGSELYESQRVDRAKLKRLCRKREPLPADVESVWTCEVCNRPLLSKAGLVNHMKSHGSNVTSTVLVAPLSAQPDPCDNPAGHNCPFCPKVCKSAGGLKRHINSHRDSETAPVPAAITQRSPLQCHICDRICNSLAGLKSHLRWHQRAGNSQESAVNDI